MNTTIENTVIAAAADVAAIPSISVPANATITVDAGEAEWVEPVITNAYAAIGTLVADQEIWLNGVHRTANEQLYVLLQRCYHLYSLMASDKEQNASLKAAIERHNEERNLGIDMNSHTMTNIIKVVFGADRIQDTARALRTLSVFCLRRIRPSQPALRRIHEVGQRTVRS